MSKKINIDDSIRQRLDEFSVTPPPHVWSTIQSEMEAKRKKRRMAYIGWISAAAVVVFAFIAGWYFNAKSTNEQPVMVEQQMAPAANNNKEEAIQQEKEIEAAEKIPVIENETWFAEGKQETSTIETIQIEHTSIPAAKDENLSVADRSFEVESHDNYRLLKQISAILSTEKLNLSLEEMRKENKQEKILPADGALMADNINNMKAQKSTERGWIVGANISPGYYSHAVNHNDVYASNMTYDSNDGGRNVGAGISVQYKTSKRLRVESGIYYAKDGQKSTNSYSLFAFENDLAPEALYDGSSTMFSNVVQADRNGITMNSTAGVIKMATTPNGANITANLESDAGLTATSTLYAEGEFSQLFEFIEVPLYLRYSLLDKKVGIEVLGGINAGFVIGNNAYLDNAYGLQNIGSTEEISALNFSGTVGLGLNYMLGEHFSFALEPRLNYYLNSINSNPDVNYRPYRIGVYTGIYYEF